MLLSAKLFIILLVIFVIQLERMNVQRTQLVHDCAVHLLESVESLAALLFLGARSYLTVLPLTPLVYG